jgi:hypothetical protein
MTEQELIDHVNDKWSLTQVKGLVRYWGKLPSPEIADIVGKTNMACIGKANRMGLEPVSTEQRLKWCKAGRAKTMQFLYGKR